jgi:hypothetical protein
MTVARKQGLSANVSAIQSFGKQSLPLIISGESNITRVMLFQRAVLGIRTWPGSPAEDFVYPLDREASFYFEQMIAPMATAMARSTSPSSRHTWWRRTALRQRSLWKAGCSATRSSLLREYWLTRQGTRPTLPPYRALAERRSSP